MSQSHNSHTFSYIMHVSLQNCKKIQLSFMEKLKQTYLAKITRLRRIKYWPDLVEILKDRNSEKTEQNENEYQT